MHVFLNLLCGALLYIQLNIFRLQVAFCDTRNNYKAKK
jgi:hypothetical protein